MCVRLSVLTSLQGKRLDCHCRHDCCVITGRERERGCWSCGISAHTGSGERARESGLEARADDGSGWEGYGVIYYPFV